MSSGETKQPISGGEKQQKYKERNESAVELNRLKQNIKRAAELEADYSKNSDFDESEID